MAPRILSVIVAHPFRKICGATNAGFALSAATAELAELELAVMWDVDADSSQGPLRVRYFRCATPAGPLTPLLPRAARIAFANSKIPTAIGSGRYDLVHIHNLFPLYAAERIADACTRWRIPFVISTHGFFELCHFAEVRRLGVVGRVAASLLVDRPFRRIVSQAASLFCLSPADMDLCREFDLPVRSRHIVTNGVSEFYLGRPRQEDVQAVREKLRLSPGVPTLLYMGSLHSYKGVDVYLESLRRVQRPFQAVVAGSFKRPEEPGRLMDATGLPQELRERVRFTGAISDVELRALYNLADVFVYPTRGDTLPLVVLEAMACGKPVVASRVGGIPFQIPADCGVVVPVEDPDATGDAVNLLLADEDLRARMGATARARVESVFRWRSAAASAIEGYSQILGVPPSGFSSSRQTEERAVAI